MSEKVSAKQRQAAPAITAASIAACGGVSSDTRRKWALRKPPLVRPGPQLMTHDAIETAIVAALANVNHKRGPDAWLVVRNDVRQHVLSGSDDLWIVMSTHGNFARVACDASDASHCAITAGGPVYVVALASVIASAREQFDEEVARLASKTGAQVAAIRQIQA
jgi:hypothetical protein